VEEFSGVASAYVLSRSKAQMSSGTREPVQAIPQRDITESIRTLADL
jgi:hypothetical protein